MNQQAWWNPGRFQSALRLSLCLFVVVWSSLAAATPLDDYVAAPDATYAYGPEPAKTITGAGYTAKVWLMKSQTWRSPSEVDRTVWEHWVTIVTPDEVKYDKALMFIGGGSNRGGDPPGIDDVLAQIAVSSKSVLAEVRMIPNQPLKVADEKDPRYLAEGRGEDELIAYTWDKFMVTGDVNWPARLPMTKAVVRAMDTVQKEVPTVKGFFVVGGSKRGWTTWTTAAVDPRVVAIAPAVIDVLNVEHSMQHHHDVYGYWAEAIGDYTDLKIMDRIHTPEFRALMKIVDPYTYIDRLTMPKYIIASTGDQFFVPDSSQFYFDALKGEKYLRYVPNTDHGLAPEAYMNLLSFYQTVLENQPRPRFSWTKEPGGALRVTAETPPTAVRLWQATNPKERNFRLDTIGKAWTSSALTDHGGGVYVGEAPAPPQGWTAFMVELEYPGSILPLKFTTAVSVVPQIVPYRKPGGWGSIRIVGEGKDAVTLIELGGDRYQMGYWYGRLLADQISRAWTGLEADVKFTDQQYADAIDAMWNSNYFDITAWESELRGIADGCADAGHTEVTYGLMLKMLATPDMSENGCSLFSAWGKATVNGDLYQTRNLDWSMTTGLQNYPVVTIYNPTDGKRHALAGFAGLIGAAVGGMNDAGLAVSEIMGYFGDAETLNGIPFPVLLRDVLYHDATLEQALERMQKATRTNQYHYAIADPAAPDPKARLLFTSNTRFDQFTDDQVCTKHPIVDPTPFYEKLDDVLYWKNHNGSGNRIIFDAIKARYGSIDADKAKEIATAAGVDGTLVSIVYHNTAREFWVAFAEGDQPAHKQKYIRFSLDKN